MNQIVVNVCPPYTVLVDKNARLTLSDLLIKQFGKVKVQIVTDSNVAEMYLKETAQTLSACGFSVFSTVLPAGEEAKTEVSLFNILKDLAKNECKKTDLLLALGGGTITDVTGLAASLYMRGISFVNVPTTLLSMVDAAIGGKCALNLDGVKNVVGTVYEPSLVLIDPVFLNSLPERYYQEGIAEIIKYTMIDADFANFYSQSPHIESIIAKSVSLKSRIVEQDEKDQGIRKILNFGHTFGHAVEAASGYQLSHGEAVAIGMNMITKAATKRGLCPFLVLSNLQDKLKNNGLPLDYQGSKEALLPLLFHDKKTAGNSISLIVPVDLGKVEILNVPTKELCDWLSDGVL